MKPKTGYQQTATCFEHEGHEGHGGGKHHTIGANRIAQDDNGKGKDIKERFEFRVSRFRVETKDNYRTVPTVTASDSHRHAGLYFNLRGDRADPLIRPQALCVFIGVGYYDHLICARVGHQALQAGLHGCVRSDDGCA